MNALLPTPEVEKRDLLSTVSASRLTTFHSCRLKFFFRYVLELTHPISPALFVGRAVHSALQLWSKARWRGQHHDAESLQTGFLMNWITGQEDEPVAWEGTEDAQQEKAWALVDNFFLPCAKTGGQKSSRSESPTQTRQAKNPV